MNIIKIGNKSKIQISVYNFCLFNNLLSNIFYDFLFV